MKLDTVSFQIMWSRVVAIADEMATTLVKTAFSHVVRENHDYACAIYDQHGRMLAQSTHCTPGHIGAMPQLMKSVLAIHPTASFSEGDILVTNDPWIGAGHTPDYFMITPIFRKGGVIGFAVNSAHHVDSGGRLGAPDARDVYEEGLIVPISHFQVSGQPNLELIALIRRNVRMSDKVLGDLRAQVSANFIGAQRVCELVDDLDTGDLALLAGAIIGFTESAMRKAIRAVPDGIYHARTTVHENAPFTIVLRLEVNGDDIHADFTGTSAQVAAPINSVLNMTLAYTLFPIKCALEPHIPNNEGCAAPIRLTVPSGSILNAEFPAACMWRTSSVYYAIEVIFAALAQAVPDKVMAPSGTYPLWLSIFSGQMDDGRPYIIHLNAQGGQGARAHHDGVSTVVFPPNVMNTPVEVFELESTLICERKALRPDSGGAGRHRGGLGQEFVFRNAGRHDVVASLVGGRLAAGAEGMFGGLVGARGSIRVNGEPLQSSRQMILAADDRVELLYPGGGGYGPPQDRDRESIRRDVENGFVSAAAAARDYGKTKP